MIVRFTPRALADIEAIADYIKAHRPRAALRVEQAISISIKHLGQHPNLGVDRPHLGVRALAVPRFPYTIYYRVDDQTVPIIHILHGARDAPGSDELMG
jgi:plasmid stabilization system protein ParE